MKTCTACLLIFMFILVAACKKKPDGIEIYRSIGKEFEMGNLKNTLNLVDSLKNACPEEIKLIRKADSLAQIAERINLDFSLSEEEIRSRLKESIGDYSPREKEMWEERKWLECRMIDGQKRYFKRAASNFNLLKSFSLERAARDSLLAEDPGIIFRKNHTQSLIDASGNENMPVKPVEMLVNYTLTVLPDAVPDGETVRCWLPWPKENHVRQKNIRLISASVDDYVISPDSMIHRTIYMEAIAEKDKPVTFDISFSYESYGQYFDLRSLNILPYNTDSELYRKYTMEERPHINFSEKVRYLTDSIAEEEDNPFEILKRFYYWINDNIPWAGALEYSIIPDIPDYVISNRRGDCGMQTFLLMSMLRYKGIPVRWQSGWMMPPGNENLHDWCEVWFEGTGWIPVDMSYGLQYSSDRNTREFYMSGIDSYRMIVNDGIAGNLYPDKKYLRSEPYDFQRGELEWSGGNLYFDKWYYEIEIEYR
ncbi:MAG: transglutaminase-like domain-containing protein [Bacteroidales bacterium]|nr:transglutaminase-like domain-containing protein [Bacteroidales bacterium]